MQRTTLHITAVQSPSHFQWYILIGKQWYELPAFIRFSMDSVLHSCIRHWSTKTILMPLDRGRFVVVHQCSTFSDHRLLATSQNAEVSKRQNFVFFLLSVGDRPNWLSRNLTCKCRSGFALAHQIWPSSVKEAGYRAPPPMSKFAQNCGFSYLAKFGPDRESAHAAGFVAARWCLWFLVFTTWRYASAVLAFVVRPSAHPSHGGIVSKRINAQSRK